MVGNTVRSVVYGIHLDKTNAGTCVDGLSGVVFLPDF